MKIMERLRPYYRSEEHSLRLTIGKAEGPALALRADCLTHFRMVWLSSSSPISSTT